MSDAPGAKADAWSRSDGARLCLLLVGSSRAMRAATQQAFAGEGLYAGQEFLLSHLWAADGQTPSELAGKLGVELPTVTRSVGRLEAAGLVRRERDPDDARAVRVVLTERARAMERTVLRRAELVGEAALAGLTGQQRSALLDGLAALRDNLRGIDPDASNRDLESPGRVNQHPGGDNSK